MANGDEESDSNIWTVILRRPDGGVEFVEATAEELGPPGADESDYVFYSDSDEVARFHKRDVLGMFRGRRTPLIVNVEPAEKG